jgi:hypothetical protein
MPKTMETTLAIMLFSNLIVMHIREGGSILSLALINLCIILIVVINKLLISLYFCWCVA